MFSKDKIKIILVGSTRKDSDIGFFSKLVDPINYRLIDDIAYQIFDYRESEYQTSSDVNYYLTHIMDGPGYSELNKNTKINAVIFFDVEATLRQKIESKLNCCLFVDFYDSQMTPEALLKSISVGVNQRLISKANTTVQLVQRGMSDGNSIFFNENLPKDITKKILWMYTCSAFNDNYASFVFFKSPKNLTNPQLLTTGEELLNSAETFVEEVKNAVEDVKNAAKKADCQIM